VGQLVVDLPQRAPAEAAGKDEGRRQQQRSESGGDARVHGGH
jgi:hypothetical protein